jgi:hypothetical protein
MSKSNSGHDHRSSRNSKDSHREEKSSSNNAGVNNGTSTTSTNRAFKDKHHPLLIAIWNTDRTQTNVDEKLKGLRDLLKKGTSRIEKQTSFFISWFSF